MNVLELLNTLSGVYGNWCEDIHMWLCINALGVKPYKDGTEWCFLYGEDLQSGISGFGASIIDAARDFYRNILKNTER